MSTVIQTVNTTYGLKHHSRPTDKMVCRTLGKDEPFDGGTDDYVYLEGDSRTENGVTVITHKSNGGNWVSLNGVTNANLDEFLDDAIIRQEILVALQDNGANVYASTSAGLAATTNGQQFIVVSGSFLNRYRNDSGSATLISQAPNATAVPLATYYSQTYMVVQRTIGGVLNLLIPASTIERAGTFVALNAPTNNRFHEQPLSTNLSQRRHLMNPATGALSYADFTTAPHANYNYELLATSVNGRVSSSKYRVIGDSTGNTVPNLFPYGKDPTEVTKTNRGALVFITNEALNGSVGGLGFIKGWGNQLDFAFYGMDIDDGIESPYYFIRIYQQHDGTVVLPVIKITFTDGTTTELNPDLEQTLGANACSHSVARRATIGKKIASIVVGGQSLGTRDIRFCGLQIYTGQTPALWIDRLDYPTVLPVSTRLKTLEDSLFTYPIVNVPPVITGTKTVGSVLSCTDGTWTALTAVTKYSYQWLRDGALISGETNKTYTLQAADSNKNVTCRVKATNIKGSRVCEANSCLITNAVYVLHLLGQSNMIGWGTNSSIDRTLDPTDYRIREYTPALGENQLSDPNFENGVGSWVGTNTSLAVSGNKLTGTVTIAAFANCNIALNGLTIGKKYRLQAKISGTVGKNLHLRIDNPQTQVYITPVDTDGDYVNLEFIANATTSKIYVITTSIPAIGDTIGIEDISLRPVLSTGNGASLVASDPLTWPLASQKSAWGVCPAMQAARDLIADGADSVILNPLAVGGTNLYNDVWSVYGAYQQNAVTQITKAVADYPVSEATHVLVWLQGEGDSMNGVSQANYQTALTDTLNSFRAITGLSSAKIIIIGMMYEFTNKTLPDISPPGAANVIAAQQAVAAALSNAVYVASPVGHAQTDKLHFTAEGSRLIGSLIANNV